MKDNFYVVGMYENPDESIFPTHIQPVIVELLNGEFCRWSYEIKRPYQIKLISRIGHFRPCINELFPYKSYEMLPVPVKMSEKSQFIAFDKKKIICCSSKITLMIRVVIHRCSTKFSIPGLICSFRCIKNILI